MRKNRTQGSVRGRSGNWLVYLDAPHREPAFILESGSPFFSSAKHKDNKDIKMLPIRSYARRQGRMFPSQRRALGDLWPCYGIREDGPLDLSALGQWGPFFRL